MNDFHKLEAEEYVQLIQAFKDIEYIKDSLKDLRTEHRKLSEELKKKSEEMRDTFYVAEKTRIAFEEHSELYLEKLENMKAKLRKATDSFEDLDTEVTNIKNSKLSFIIKTVAATVLAGLVIAKQLGYI